MNNTKYLSSIIYPDRKSSLQTLYDIHINAKKRKIDSYKKVFLLKKNVEKENCPKMVKNKKSISTTPNIDSSQSLTHKSENNSVLDKINQGRRYSHLHLKYKTILHNMEEYEKKIKAKVQKKTTTLIKSRNPTEDMFFHLNSKESSIHAGQSFNNIEEQFDRLFLHSTEPTLSQCNQTMEENFVKNNKSIKYSEIIDVSREELESNYIKKENLTKTNSNNISDFTNKNNNNNNNNNKKLKMNSKTRASFNSTSTKSLRNSITSKYEQDLEEKEKFKQAVLNKKFTKSTTNLLINKPKLSSVIKTYGIVSKTVAARKSVTNLSKTPENRVSQRESLIIPLSESNIDKAERSHGVITLDLNDTETKNQENQNNENQDVERLNEEEVYACELSNIYEDLIEKNEHDEEKVIAANHDLTEIEKSAEVITENVEYIEKLPVEEANARNSVIINIQNSFNDLMINKVNDITLTYESHNITSMKDKYNINDDSNIVDSQINFSINNKKDKSFLITSQNGFDIITPKVLNIYHNENSNKSPRGNKNQNFENFIEEEVEKEKSLNYSNDNNMVNEINENIININAQQKKSFEEDRIKTIDNFLIREKANETVNMKEIEYDDGLVNQLLCPKYDLVNNQPENNLKEILLKNKKFTQLLEMIERPASENESYAQKNFFKSEDKKVNHKKVENNGEFYNKSKNEDNSKSLLNNIALTRKIISQNEKSTNPNVIDNHSLKKGDLFVQPNQSVNLNTLNDFYNSYNPGNTKIVNTVIYRKPTENNSKNNKIEFSNKFFDERIATEFAHKYIKSEANNKSLTSSSKNKINKYLDLYNDNSVRKNINTNFTKINNNNLKSSFNNLKISQPRQMESLKTIFEKNNDNNENKGKLPLIDICFSHKKESYSKRNQTEERVFNIMPSNDIDMKQIRWNKNNMMHLIR